MSHGVKAALVGAATVFLADRFRGMVAQQASLPAIVKDNAGLLVGALAGFAASKVL